MKPTATMAGENMLVAVRMRPLSSKEKAKGEKSCCQVIGDKIVAITKAQRPGAVLKSEMGSVNEYQFDEAFNENVSQEEVYKRTAKRIIPSVLEGFNVTVFAYGATGAGKTHTMMGSERIDSERATGAEGNNEVCGIIPLTLMDIFEGLKEKKELADLPNEKWELSVSFLEVYNEKIRDLLEPSGINLPVQEDPKAGIVGVGRLARKKANNVNQVMDLLRYGNGNRKTHATDANNVSSRSHAVLQIILKQTWENSKGKNVVRESRVNLIDLAGSERAGKTNNRGARLMEGANINRSLLALANCINALAQGSTRKNAKYRDSKLTHLLKSSLEGQCKLIIIANINPSDQMFEDSHNTLKYANRAKCMKIDPKVVRLKVREMAWPQREKNINRQKEAAENENELLKKQVDALQSMLNGNCPILPNNGLDVLTNLKAQVNSGGLTNAPTRPKGSTSPTHSCPGNLSRRSKQYKRQSLDSQSVSFSGKSRGAAFRRRRASVNDMNPAKMKSINEDFSVKSGSSGSSSSSSRSSSSSSRGVDVVDIIMEGIDGGDEDEFVHKSKKARNTPEKLPIIQRNDSNSMMDVSDISEISAHESVLANGFDDNAPVEDRVGALESRVMDMAQSRRVMLDFITHLQNQKSEAESEHKSAQKRAEKLEREVEEQKALVQKLQAHLAEVGVEGGAGLQRMEGGEEVQAAAQTAATPSVGMNQMTLDTPKVESAEAGGSGNIQNHFEKEQVEIGNEAEIESENIKKSAVSHTPTKRKKDQISDETGDVIVRPVTGRRIVAVKARRRSGSLGSNEEAEKENVRDVDESDGKSGGAKNLFSNMKVNFQNAIRK